MGEVPLYKPNRAHSKRGTIREGEKGWIFLQQALGSVQHSIQIKFRICCSIWHPPRTK